MLMIHNFQGQKHIKTNMFNVLKSEFYQFQVLLLL
jgi:hypothetical protein